VDGAFTGQQPFTQKPLGAVEAAAFHELMLMRDEDVTDVPGIVHEVQMLAGHPHVRQMP
jgi:hypothetical protein